MAIDNEDGAMISQHVSPAVGGGKTPPTEDVTAVLDTDAGVLPAASGAEGTPELRQTAAVQSDKLEH